MALTTHELAAGNVRAAMARRRLTTRQVADWLGLGPAVTASRLSGKVPFRIDELGILAEAMGIPVASFLEDSEHYR